MPRPVKTNPRLIKTGDLVRTPTGDEVVRFVTVVVHLANGVDEVYEDTDTVLLVKRPDPVTEEQVSAL